MMHTSTWSRERIDVGFGTLPRLGQSVRDLGIAGRAHVITDERVGAHHGAAVLASLRDAGLEPDLIAVPPVESSKSLAQVGRLYEWLVDRRIERADVVVALGGGLVGDLAGFVAATILRGVALVHVPTTLLAMLDSAIGGKTGVNLARGKNLVGAFYPARLSFMDVALLGTLSRREVASGWAEGIKYGFIVDPDLLETLEREAPALLALDPALAAPIIERCATHKVDVVAEDPREQGRRIILNFGHTIGHAIETATGYGCYLHGEAVAIGMVAAARIGERVGVSASGLADRLVAVLARYELPVAAPGLDPAAILAATALDKKVEAGAVRWVFVAEPGRTAVRRDVPTVVVDEVVRALVADANGPRGGR